MRNVSVTDDERKAARQAEADVLPTVDYGPNYAQGIQRRGNQGAIIRNPNAMSTEDRIAHLASTLKGFPSLRRLAAEQIMREDQRYEDAFNNAQARNDAADADLAKLQSAANEDYANRRLRANIANADLAESRRNNDANRQVEREGNLLNALGGLQRRSASSGSEAAKGFTSLAQQYGGDYDQAAWNAYRNLIDAGINPRDNDLGAMAETRLNDALVNGRQRVNSRGPFGTSLFSPNDAAQYSANPLGDRAVERNPIERGLSALFPWGARFDDYKYIDRNTGQSYYSDVPPPGGDSYGYNRLMDRRRQLSTDQNQQ